LALFAVDPAPLVVTRFDQISPARRRDGSSQRTGGGEVAVLGVALILYVAAIVALAHALARE
jgi:hypothetical protein